MIHQISTYVTTMSSTYAFWNHYYYGSGKQFYADQQKENIMKKKKVWRKRFYNFTGLHG